MGFVGKLPGSKYHLAGNQRRINSGAGVAVVYMEEDVSLCDHINGDVFCGTILFGHPVEAVVNEICEYAVDVLRPSGHRKVAWAPYAIVDIVRCDIRCEDCKCRIDCIVQV